VLLAASLGSKAEVDEMLLQLRTAHFYELRHAKLFDAMRMLRMENHAVDLITLKEWLEARGLLEDCGGLGYVASLDGVPPGIFNFGEYLDTLRDKAHRRWLLAKSCELTALAGEPVVTLEQTQERLAELFDATHKAAGKKLIEIISPKDARAFEPDPSDFLIGSGLIAREQFVTIGGEPGCGKSRLATTLGVALARGSGSWMGYPVRSAGRTLILQTENKGTRLKEEFAAVPAELDECIRVSKALPHGLAFASSDFRRELTRLCEKWPFELLVVDPWNDVVSEEGQGDYAEALLNIARCFHGRRMPAVVIVAHLRKPRADASGRRKSGRELLHELSGSLKLGSTSRTVFAVQPASYSMDDDRIVFEVAKANDCDPAWLREHGTRSAWHRRNAAFEGCREFDWEEWMNPGQANAEKRSVTLDMVQSVFKATGRHGMKRGELVREISERFEVGESTVWRSIKGDGYARKWIDEAGGIVALRRNSNEIGCSSRMRLYCEPA
jgi:energy-coupling factor transporter ATP-binding protein EcfA2